MLRYSIIFLFIIQSALVFSQDSIVYFDRPGIGDGPYIVQKGKIKIETGTVFNPAEGIESTYNPGILVRGNISPSNELRLMYNYAPQSLLFSNEPAFNGSTFVSTGMKQRIARTPNCFADIGLTANIYFPLQKMDYLGNYCFDTYLLFEHNAPSGSYINYSLGYIYAGEKLESMNQFSFCGNWYLGNGFLLFGEYFNYYQWKNNKLENGFDAGIVYEFNGNMQLDFSAIYNRFGAEKSIIYALGYSICITTKRSGWNGFH
jgi:hypothetical protein